MMLFCVRPGQARLACIELALSHVKDPSSNFFLPSLPLLLQPILSYPCPSKGTRGPPAELLGRCGGIIPIFTPTRVFHIREIWAPSTSSSAPIKNASPPRLLRILPWYRQIMMPCQTATITYRETRQVTDGHDPVLAERCAVVRTYFFSSCSPAAAGSRAQICAVGFVGNPDLLSLPPSKVLSCWHAARAAAYLATPVPHFEPQEAPKWPRRTHVGHAHARLAGVGSSITELDCPRSSDATCRYLVHVNQRPSEFCPLLRDHLGHPTEFRVKRQAHHW